jgi:hypothetical protein
MFIHPSMLADLAKNANYSRWVRFWKLARRPAQQDTTFLSRAAPAPTHRRHRRSPCPRGEQLNPSNLQRTSSRAPSTRPSLTNGASCSSATGGGARTWAPLEEEEKRRSTRPRTVRLRYPRAFRRGLTVGRPGGRP